MGSFAAYFATERFVFVAAVAAAPWVAAQANALGIAQAMWVLEVQKLGPFLVEGDREGRSLFALANREINLRLDEVYRGLPAYAMSRFGESTSRKDELV